MKSGLRKFWGITIGCFLAVSMFVPVNVGAVTYDEPFVDTDNDGMPNGWEREQSSSTTRWIRCLDLLVFDSDQDTDGDGLTNLEEYNGSQNPTNPCIANTSPPQCSNGIDDEGDGLIDFPDDPDCLSPIDNAELKPEVIGAYYAIAYQVAVKDNFAYLNGLEMIDISDPTNPTLYMKYLKNNISGVYGNYAYILRDFQHEIEIIDFSDPSNPVKVGVLDNIPTAPIVILDHYAYVGKIQVLDISDPVNPVKVGGISSSARYKDVSVHGDEICYVFSGGFHCYDVSDRANPKLNYGFNSYSWPHAMTDATGIHFDGRYVYVAASNNGIVIFDTSPGYARYVSTYRPDEVIDYFKDVYSLGNYLFAAIADGYFNQMDVIDISDPASPRKIWSGIAMNSGGYSIVARDNYVYLGGLGTYSPGLWTGTPPGGLYVIDVHGPDTDNDGAYDYWECDSTDPNNWDSCSTCADLDGDGFFAGCDAYTTINGPDCDDSNPDVYPGAPEIWDGLDNQCPGDAGYGIIDEGFNPDIGACITHPGEGKKFNGNLLLVKAEICVGAPEDVSMVEFQWRPLGDEAWNDVEAAVTNGGKELSRDDPFAVHWDTTGLANGAYELRAVAYDDDMAVDPDPAVTWFMVDLNGAGSKK